MAVCSQSYLKEKMKMESGARLPGARQGCTCTRHLLPDAPHSTVRILRTDGRTPSGDGTSAEDSGWAPCSQVQECAR